jgi:hypothetical protein
LCGAPEALRMACGPVERLRYMGRSSSWGPML